MLLQSEANQEHDVTDRQAIEDKFKDLLTFYQCAAGKQELADAFDPSNDGDVSEAEFVDAFPKFVAALGGNAPPADDDVVRGLAVVEPEPELDPEPEQEPEDDIENGGTFGAEDGAGAVNLTKQEKKAKKAEDKANAAEAKAQGKIDKQNAKDKAKVDKQQSKDAAKAKKRKEKAGAKARKKRAKSGAGAPGHEDSDDEENWTGEKTLAPRGAKELFRYFASTGSAAPRGMAITLYVAVNERLPHSVAMSMVYLVIGADLGARDVANLLALISLEKKSVESASDQYFKLTEKAWKEKDIGSEHVKENFGRQLREYQASGKEEEISFELGVSEAIIEDFLQQECEELGLNIDSVSGAWDKRKGAEIRRGWDVKITQGEGPPVAEGEEAAAPGADAAEPVAAAAEPADEGEDLELADRVQGGDDDDEAVDPADEAPEEDPTAEEEEPAAEEEAQEGEGEAKLTKEEKKAKKAAEKEEKAAGKAAEKEAKAAAKDEALNGPKLTAEQQEDLDIAYRSVAGRKDGRLANTLFRLSRTASHITHHEASELYIAAREVLKPELLGNGGLEGLLDGHWPVDTLAWFDKGAISPRAGSPKVMEQEMSNPLASRDDEEAGNEMLESMNLGEKQRMEDDADMGSFDKEPPDDMGALSPKALRRYAKEFEPAFVPTAYASLVAMLLSQASNFTTLKSIQTLIMRQAMPPDQVEAIGAVSAKQGVSYDDMNALIWLWTGGARPAMAIPMTQPPNAETPQPVESPGDAKGKLELTVVRANGLLKKDRMGKSDPFCTVRVEGHQRNTPVIKKTLDPEWNLTMGFRVTDRSTAIVEVYIFDEDKNDETEPLGRVTFPLLILEQDASWNDPETPLEVEFEIEPMRVMTEKSGELGTLTLQLNFTPSDVQPVVPGVTSDRIERLICTLQEHRVNADVIQYIREAAAIVLTRTAKEMQNQMPPQPTLAELAEIAEAETKATGPQEAMLLKQQLEYDLDADKASERASNHPIRQKYMTAIAYCLGKFLGINPSVLGIIAGTIIKFAPAPAVTGAFAAATLGVLGLPEQALSGIKKFLEDRLYEEMEKLVRAARLDNQYFKELQKMCRGQGCAQAMVDRASGLVAQADSFSTAAALFRLKDGQGAAEPEECTALDAVVETSPDDFVTAGVQNLQLLIWPAREETFDLVRELMDGNKAAEQGLSGWENRAELALILKSDQLSMKALRGLIHMEEFRVYLDTKKKDLEKIALAKLMAGDKAACAIMRRLTPSTGEKIEKVRNYECCIKNEELCIKITQKREIMYQNHTKRGILYQK